MIVTRIRYWVGSVSTLSWLLVLSVVILVVSSLFWWQIVYKSPERVFDAMIQNNFATSGFTRAVTSDENNVAAQELAQIQTGGENIVRTNTTLKQGEDRVVTDAISTPTQEFVRYQSIETTRKDKNGKEQDFSKAVNVWAKNDTGAPGQGFTQMLLGIVPMGNVSPDTRAKLNKFMKEHTVFSTNYNTVKKETVKGRSVYTYEVQLLPQSYVGMLKIYGDGVGLGEQVAQLNAEDYKNAEPTNLVISVDVQSRNVTAISYADNAGRKEAYSGFGIRKYTELPKKTITNAELQQRLGAN